MVNKKRTTLKEDMVAGLVLLAILLILGFLITLNPDDYYEDLPDESQRMNFTIWAPEWEVCSSEGLFRAACYEDQKNCDRLRNDSMIKILNMTEENCDR